jgi:hypothetical protein
MRKKEEFKIIRLWNDNWDVIPFDYYNNQFVKEYKPLALKITLEKSSSIFFCNEFSLQITEDKIGQRIPTSRNSLITFFKTKDKDLIYWVTTKKNGNKYYIFTQF